MRIHRLHLRNFRQFRSESLEFAAGEDENITIIHGQNGSGKTTIKNAFLFNLYGRSLFSLHSDELANQGAMAETEAGGTVSVEVSLEFEHDDTLYRAVRTREYQKQGEDDYFGEIVDENLELNYEDEHGNRGSRQNPQQSIEQILPNRLSNLFFFDGEYITQLSEGNSQKEIQSAIENVMGLTILERAIDHLDETEREFSKEVQGRADSKLRGLISERDRLRDDIEDKEQLIKTKRDSRKRLDQEIKEIDAKLEGIEEAADLQKERSSLEEDIDRLEAEISEINSQIDSIISKKALIPLALPAVEATARELDELREKGEIPSEISNEFVELLLEQEQCICGRELEKGTKKYEKVSTYKSNVGVSGFEESAMQLVSQLNTIRDERGEYIESIDSKINERSEAKEALESTHDRIDEITGRLKNMDIENSDLEESPSELQRSRDAKISKKAELKKEIQEIEREKASLTEELEEVNDDISEAKQKKKAAELSRRRMKTTGEVRKQLMQSYDDLKDRVREWSNKLVSETFEKIATKGYSAEITDEFELKIRDQISGEYLEVDKSRGERQIASLTFIASLTQIARERYESDSEEEYFSGGIYPVVMDSPYGALDDEHRRTVSQIIPSMANQVIVLVTDSQWRGPVANELDEAEKQYRLEYKSGDKNNSYPRTEIIEET
jgi:DNA sulfur modification protein DndD